MIGCFIAGAGSYYGSMRHYDVPAEEIKKGDIAKAGAAGVVAGAATYAVCSGVNDYMVTKAANAELVETVSDMEKMLAEREEHISDLEFLQAFPDDGSYFYVGEDYSPGEFSLKV